MNEITDTLLNSEPEHAKARVTALAKCRARALGMSVEDIAAAAETAQQKLEQMAQAMNLQVSAQSPARRLFASPAAREKHEAETAAK